jgi:hypothetical protein
MLVTKNVYISLFHFSFFYFISPASVLHSRPSRKCAPFTASDATNTEVNEAEANKDLQQATHEDGAEG